RIAGEAQRHELTVGEIVDARLQVGWQELPQLEPHLEPDEAVLHRDRLEARQKPEHQQRGGHDQTEHHAKRRHLPEAPGRNEHVREENWHDEEMKPRQPPGVLLITLYAFGHRNPPYTHAGARMQDEL